MKRLFLLGGLLLLLGAGCSVTSNVTPTNTSTSPTTTNTNPSSTSTSETSSSTLPTTTSTSDLQTEDSIRVSAQKADTYITINTVNNHEPAFVAIREDATERPGSIIATSTLLSPGEHADVPIRFMARAGKWYWATIYADNGDSAFSSAKDLPVKDAAGNVVQVRFEVQSTGTTPTATNTSTTTNPTVTVGLQNFTYVPSTLMVTKGAKITFTNKDQAEHTVTADLGAFDSGTLRAGSTYTLDTTSLAAGTYLYHCSIHPTMRGVIVVR